MRLHLRTEGIKETETLRRFVERKLRFALGRFGARIHSVSVRVSDINGPRGGEDISCLVQAHVGPGSTLRISETRGDAFAAVSHASSRLAQRVGRHVDRFKRRRRGR